MIKNPSKSLEYYSTGETVVGTWTDGKPIYRRVIYAISSSSVTNIFDTTDLNVDTCVTLHGYIQSSVFSTKHKQRIGDGAVNGTGSLWIRDSGMMALITAAIDTNPTLYDGQVVTIIFEYTKTTDIATIEIPSATVLLDAYVEGVNNA